MMRLAYPTPTMARLAVMQSGERFAFAFNEDETNMTFVHRCIAGVVVTAGAVNLDLQHPHLACRRCPLHGMIVQKAWIPCG